MTRGSLFDLAPRLTLGLLTVPVLAGLAGTLLPAFGWLPALGGTGLSLDPFRALFATPGLGRSAWLSLSTGFGATLVAFGVTVLVLATFHGTPIFRAIERMLSPLLSVPHAAAALGLAFLVAPSGWLARMFSPWATGRDVPADLLIVGDPWGLALMGGLAVKEVPFLMLMALAALPQTDATQGLAVARTLGYGTIAAWLKVVLPRLYPQIRLPVYAVLAYSVSTVEVAMILGPTTPATLAVRLTDWMRDPDLSLWFIAAAGAVLQLALVLAALALWRAGESAAARLGRSWTTHGGRMRRDGALRVLGGVAAFAATLPLSLGLAGLALWSVAGPWPFPDALPQRLDLSIWWRNARMIGPVVVTSLVIGVASVALALTLVIASLESGHRTGRRASRVALWMLYLPLIVPQIAFLFGLQMLGIALGADGSIGTVILAHLVFVLPYVYLSLSDPWAATDPRLTQVAASLGARPGRAFLSVRLPMMLAPILTAAAVGFAVSIGLYLPTLLIGGGRIETLTTEAVALAAGGDRRLIGVYALLQMLAPFAAFALALGLPALVWRNRAGMRVRS